VAFALLAFVMVLAGCRVDARVDVRLREDGSGTVTARITLDADAVRRATTHAALTQAVPFDDVKAAGWTVSPWHTTSSGAATVRLSREFVGQDDLARRLSDLTGPNGMLRDARVSRERGWFRSTDRVSLTVDLHDLPAAVSSDTQLASSLRAAGLDVAALDAQLRDDVRQGLRVRVVVHAPPGHDHGVTVRPGTAATTVAAGGTEVDSARVVTLAAAAVLASAALLLLTVAARSRRREQRRMRSRRASP
jgi:hypothetical protein